MDAGALVRARQLFAAGPAQDIARALGENLRRFGAGKVLTKTAEFFADTQHLALIVGSHERQVDIDRALGWGLAWAGDRELWLALPRARETPTLRRAALLDTTVRVFVHADTALIEELLVPDRSTALTAYTDAVVLAVHDLGSKDAWVGDLVDWAQTHPDLRAAHRPSYRSWHCLGRMVLKIARRHGGLRVSAGVHALVASDQYVAKVVIELDGPINVAERSTIQDAAGAAIAARLSGADGGHAEHFLQARLGDHPDVLGLVPESVRREFPCVRPGGERAYIDLLGVDSTGAVHIVETKIGSDVMLVLQGLDYWAWAEAHRAELTAELGVASDAPIKLDFVVARPASTGLPLGPYTAPQTEVLPWDLKWRFGLVEGWRLGEGLVSVKFGKSGVVPPDVAGSPSSPPRYRRRLEAHLRKQFAGQLNGSSMTVNDAAHIVSEARPAWDAIGASNLFHKWAHHVRSSQAFAVNLFAPLAPDAVATLLGSAFRTEMVSADPAMFEYSDPLDELRESASPHGHRTQVDVLLSGQSIEGPVALLVEVKLAETDFGWCSAATSAKNDRTDICARSGPFGREPAGCFQLRNFNAAERRRYDEFLEPNTSYAAPGCWFRRSASQPMRNVALAEVLRRRQGGRVAVALCAPAEHRAMWTRWDAIRPAFDEDTLVDLPAEHVLAALHDAVATRLRDMYGLGAAQDGRVVADLEWQTWTILASLVERYETPPIVVELHPGGGTYNCMSLATGPGWQGPVVGLNRGGGMHTHHPGGGMVSVRDGWRRAARWGCDEVADEVARAAGFATRRPPVASELRDFAADVATELLAGRRAGWLNGMLDTSGYGAGVRAELFEWFPELTTPRDPGNDGLQADVYRHWFLATSNDGRPLKHRYLEHSSPIAPRPA